MFCACGKPLHYSNPAMRMVIDRLITDCGTQDVTVRIGNRTWIVQRHYIALHGLKARELPNLKFPEILDNDKTFLPYKFDTGGVIVDPHNIDYRDQIFSHTDPDDQRTRNFHVTKLKQLIRQNTFPLIDFEISETHAKFVADHRLIDQTHITERMTDALVNEPGIICLFSDESQLTVDGNHRFIKRFQLGMPTMQFWLVPESAWRKSLVNVPSAFESPIEA